MCALPNSFTTSSPVISQFFNSAHYNRCSISTYLRRRNLYPFRGRQSTGKFATAHYVCNAFHFTWSEFIYSAKDSTTTNRMAGKCTHTHYIKYTSNETEPDTYSVTTLVRGLVILAWRRTCDANNLYEIREKRMNGWIQMGKNTTSSERAIDASTDPDAFSFNFDRVFI